MLALYPQGIQISDFFIIAVEVYGFHPSNNNPAVGEVSCVLNEGQLLDQNRLSATASSCCEFTAASVAPALLKGRIATTVAWAVDRLWCKA